MRRLTLDIHGVGVVLASSDEAVLEALNRDFEYFVTRHHPPSGRTIRLTLEPRVPPSEAKPGGRTLLRSSDFDVFDDGGSRYVAYSDGAAARYDFRGLAGVVWCAEPERLHELAYLTVLSRAGEELERRGWHRVHALGFELDGEGGLLLLPSGGGKSVLALESLRSSRLGHLADDTPLISRDLRLAAFPLRWGFRPETDLSGVSEDLIRPFSRRRYGPKRLVDLAHFRHRVRPGAPLRWLLVGRRAGARTPALEPLAKLEAGAALALHLVLGLGIAQLREYMLRPDPAGLMNLARLAWSRTLVAASILKSCRPHLFQMSDDPRANLGALQAFLEEGRPVPLEGRATALGAM